MRTLVSSQQAVRSRLTGQDYAIIVGPGGRDPAQKSDAAGQRAWSVFRF